MKMFAFYLIYVNAIANRKNPSMDLSARKIWQKQRQRLIASMEKRLRKFG